MARSTFGPLGVAIMEMKARLTLLVGPDVVKELDEEVKARGMSQSEVVEEGIKLLRKKRLEELMARPAVASERDYGIGFG